MSERKEETSRIVLTNGDAVVVTVRSGIIIDDLIVQGAKAEAYRLMTGQDVFPEVGRDIKDYLIKTGVILD
jgi:hypothetical protein